MKAPFMADTVADAIADARVPWVPPSTIIYMSDGKVITRRKRISLRRACWNAWRNAERQYQCGLLRDIFGNPFRPAAMNPSWLTGDVLELAKAIYSERAFERMSALADALERAGCDNSDVLAHCRELTPSPARVLLSRTLRYLAYNDGHETAPHTRGCWVLDLLLGKV